MIRLIADARPVDESQVTSVAHILGLPLAASNLPGMPVRKRYRYQVLFDADDAVVGSAHPYIRLVGGSVSRSLSSAVGMWVCVPSTAVTLPSRCQPIATFSLVASA